MNKQIKQIEQLLGITIEEQDHTKENQVNTFYVWKKDQTLRALDLKNIHIKDINVLLPFSKFLHTLKFTNCTINSIIGLFHFQWLGNLTLDNVIINDLDNCLKNQNCSTVYQGNLKMLNLLNMEIEHLSVLAPMAKDLDHVFITNCVLHNFYEVNLFPRLYDFRLDHVIIKKADTDKDYESNPDRNFTWLNFANMQLDDIAYFVPVARAIHGISLTNCEVGSINKLHQFTQIEQFSIDSSTRIKGRNQPVEIVSSFKIKECIVGENEDAKKNKVDLQNLASIAPYIKGLDFHHYVSDDLGFLKHFTQLENIEFTSSIVPLSDFLPIAHQIKAFDFHQSELQEPEQFVHFKSIEGISFDTYPYQKGLVDFKKLLPLKNQLKVLKLDEDEIKNLEVIKEFTALESLDISAPTISVMQTVLSFPTLVKLRLNSDIEEELGEMIALNIESLTNIEELQFYFYEETVELKGLGNLKELKRLALNCNCSLTELQHLKKLAYLSIDQDIDINKVPELKSLKTLELDVDDDYEIHSLEQFPNLENLKIGGTTKLKLGKLEKLKVLKLEADFTATELTVFDELPSLEKLDLGCCSISEIKNLKNLTNLKVLDLSENEIEDIDDIKALKSLEQLNLYENKLTDVSPINALPHLHQVNLGYNEGIEGEVYKKQLNKPETAIFLGMGRVPFWIWKNQYLEL